MASDIPELPLIEQVAKDVAVLRRSFNEGKTLPFSARRASLEAFRRMIQENTSLIHKALWDDLRKNELESDVTEILMLLNELQEQLDNFEDWAAPQRVSQDPMNMPGSSAIHSDPLGVCCVIGTWNYPFMLTLKPVIGCLAAGNTCLIRAPSAETSSNSAALIAELVRKYLDNSLVRVVEGEGEASKAVLAQKFDMIFYTGGTYGGKFVARAAAENFCRTVLEMGGKNPVIVDPSADMQVAGKRIAWGAFFNAGQTCVRPDYILVHVSVADRFIESVKESIAAMYGGSFGEIRESLEYGRIVNNRYYERLMGMLEGDKDYIIHGGNGEKEQCYIEPTVLDFGTHRDAFSASEVMAKEIFGPVMPILRYESLDQAIDVIREHPKPLTLYCFTTNRSVHEYVFSKASSGGAVVNECMLQNTNSALPFGGVGNSGMGNYHGKATFDAFSHKKSVMYKTNYLDIPQRYPPYTPFAKTLITTVMAPISRKQMFLVKMGFCSVALAIALKFFF